MMVIVRYALNENFILYFITSKWYSDNIGNTVNSILSNQNVLVAISKVFQSRPNKAGLKCLSIRPSLRTYVHTYVHPSVHTEVFWISLKFAM